MYDALADLLLLPPARVNADPALTADLFVCRVAGREWDAARPLAARLDESNRGRSDVKAALKKLPAEKVAEEPAVAQAKPPAPEPKPVGAAGKPPVSEPKSTASEMKPTPAAPKPTLQKPAE